MRSSEGRNYLETLQAVGEDGATGQLRIFPHSIRQMRFLNIAWISSCLLQLALAGWSICS